MLMTPEEQAAADEAKRLEEAELLKNKNPNWDDDEDEEDGDDDDQEEDLSKLSSEELVKRLKEKDQIIANKAVEADKWKTRAKKNYKKWADDKEVKTTIDSESVVKIVKSVTQDETQKSQVIEKYQLSGDKFKEVEKLKNEKGLSREEAAKLSTYDDLQYNRQVTDHNAQIGHTWTFHRPSANWDAIEKILNWDPIIEKYGAK